MAGNSFFQFKQFTIHQDQATMKVCTDACVLGAWADVGQSEKILDIGAGTGLLSLMVAQRNASAHIDAVELDNNAFVQASENVANSPFQSRIDLFNAAIQDFCPSYQYDCIITNPPFYQSDLRSPSEKKNQAHHASTLTFDELLSAIERLLRPVGTFSILLPVDEAAIFSGKAMEKGWIINRNMLLHHSPRKKAFRQLMTFSKGHFSECQSINESLCIYNVDGGSYDDRFRLLMKDFYLKF